ncbi:MAG TPA: hypothetical protein VM345_19155 [Acidimicrobiales bacterium]|jgi:hypothetical protein|nr:hypothetical protein [Acidimicrobiales bacterium]
MGAATATVEGDLRRQVRESRAIAFFGTWAIVGLFVDGWAHQANKPETFFTPWHFMLYSGFVAAVLWFAWDGRRSGARGRTEVVPAPSDRLASIGLVAFVIGGVGDGIWHEVFGVEVDLEALLSPTHLLLMTGGLLMLSAPVRWALSERTLRDSTRHLEFAPVLVALTLCSSLATFFTMYAGANWPIARFDEGENGEVVGVASVLARNLLVMAPLLFARLHWRLPVGSWTLMLGANALLMSALEGFRFPQLVIPFVIGGIVGDALSMASNGRRAVPWWAYALAVPFATWSSFFAVHELAWGIEWTVELWTGAIFLAMASAYGLGALMQPRTS